MVVRNTFVEVEEHSEEEQVRSCFSHRLNRVEHGTGSGRLGACTCTIFTYLSIIYTYIWCYGPGSKDEHGVSPIHLQFRLKG